MGEADGKPSRRGRRQNADGSKLCIRREITYSDWHEAQLQERMAAQGIGRSEAIRQVIHEAYGSRRRIAAAELRNQLSVVKLNATLARARPSHLIQFMAEIDEAVDRIGRLVGEAMG